MTGNSLGEAKLLCVIWEIILRGLTRTPVCVADQGRSVDEEVRNTSFDQGRNPLPEI